jgi:hypothetical protein
MSVGAGEFWSICPFACTLPITVPPTQSRLLLLLLLLALSSFRRCWWGPRQAYGCWAAGSRCSPTCVLHITTGWRESLAQLAA